MKIFAAKISLFIAIVFLCQSLISKFFIYREKEVVPKNVLLVEQYLKERTDIIYFGDSVLFWAQPSAESATIPDLLRERIPGYRVGVIAHEAYTPVMYLEFCRFIAEKARHPKLLIIPINMRVFSPEWDKNPGYQFEKERLFLKSGNAFILNIFYHPLSIFKMFHSKITEYDYQNTLVFDEDTIVGKVSELDNLGYRTWSRSKMKNKIIFRYLYRLTERHRQVQALIKAAELLHKRQIGSIFYITPLDYQTAEKYIGQRFKNRVSQNVALLKGQIERKGVCVLDLVFSLDAGFFNWKQFLYPNEHLTLQGKQFVAERVGEEIKKLSP